MLEEQGNNKVYVKFGVLLLVNIILLSIGIIIFAPKAIDLLEDDKSILSYEEKSRLEGVKRENSEFVQTMTGVLTNYQMEGTNYLLTLESYDGGETHTFAIPKEEASLKRQVCNPGDCDILTQFFNQPDLISKEIEFKNNFKDLEDLALEDLNNDTNKFVYIVAKKEVSSSEMKKGNYLVVIRETSQTVDEQQSN